MIRTVTKEEERKVKECLSEMRAPQCVDLDIKVGEAFIGLKEKILRSLYNAYTPDIDRIVQLGMEVL